jgi:hypothetical protein
MQLEERRGYDLHYFGSNLHLHYDLIKIVWALWRRKGVEFGLELGYTIYE